MSEIDHSEFIRRVEEYIQWDPVESTRTAIRLLYDNKQWDELEKCIMHRLTFGTAGFTSSIC